VLFVHSDDGDLYALDPTTGTERWRAHISDVDRIPMGSENSRNNNYASSAVVADGIVYVGGFDGSVVALDLAGGEERWRFSAGATVAATPAVADGRVFFGSFNGKIYALDATSGRELWQVDTGAAVVSSPLVFDDLVVIGSRSYDILALDVATGERAWKHYYWFSWIESSAVEQDGVGYVGASDGQDLLALDLADGEVLWRFDTHGSAWPQPAVTQDAVFIGTLGFADYWANHNGAFFAVDRQTGQPIWQFPQERPGEADSWGFAASPAVSGGLVFAADLEGRVYAFQAVPDSVR
jgi:outer membrane protein assembly factor BamB